MKRILITGGAGFIGSRLALKLLSQGYNIVVLDNLSPQVHGDNPKETSPLYRSIREHVDFIKGSVTSRETLLSVLQGVDAVVHLAAETGTGQSMYDIYNYVNVNIGGSALLLDILANCSHSVKRIVVAESRAVYGEGRYWSPDLQNYVYPQGRLKEDMAKGDFSVKLSNSCHPLQVVATTEDSWLRPNSVYGITKQVQGQLLHLVCGNIGVESVSFRYQNVFGPGQSLNNPYTGILSIFSTRIKNGNPICIYEDGLESRDFVYIDDVVDATILGLETKNISGCVFNIGSGVPTTVLTVANTLKKYYGIDVPVEITGNFRQGDIRHNYADITHAQQLLGFCPKWSFDDGIKKFVEWVNTQSVREDKYDASILELKNRGLYN